MSVYEMAKSYYVRGRWGAERIRALVAAGKPEKHLNKAAHDEEV